ncbi:vitamin K epoxide reductase family protein [Aeromicrobium endophyticum]|uniref:Vitamin K epoxide reductase n=1 Tax=Aeromicrobium endophyticum TaxID=2292704 RepID=A0A371P9I8_9ACTN|nr:vitamin K epoxide reductase family protein [Aeromicrobium endophyticum]REK72591.1 Vitamin K epoxide reductase [Aeromicrobium endophyticum]
MPTSLETDHDPDVIASSPWETTVGWVMAVGGAIGMFAAFVLSADKVGLLQAQIDGTQKNLGCDLSAFVSCSSVIASSESEAFGFPNSFIGIAGFAGVLMLGVLVIAKVELPRFIWAGLQVGVLFGIGFVTWLQYQSIYDIGKLCPYCMVVWTVMIPIFVNVTAANLRRFVPQAAITRFVSNWTLMIVLLWYVVIASAIWFKFGETLWA